MGWGKDHRPDLAQVKVMLSTLDPLGMPSSTDIVSGEKADDPLYIPAIERVRSTLKTSGLLYIGDCKMASSSTRGCIASGADYYLCPLNAKQITQKQLIEYLQPVWTQQQQLTTIDYDYADGTTKQIAVGFERIVVQTIETSEATVAWNERQLVVRSLTMAETEEKSLRNRLQKTLAALEQLKQPRRGKKRLTSLDSWQEAAMEIVKRHRTTGLIKLDFVVKTIQRLLRRHLERPAQKIEESSIEFKFEVDSSAVANQIRTFGWRVYVTNQVESELSLASAVRAYRDEYLAERGFARLKGFPLSLTPIYLQRDDHITGLIRLLSIGLRVLTLLEFQVRRRLSEDKEKLAGLYTGNPQRATSRPTAELLLAAFKEITLLLIEVKDQIYVHLTPLSPLQQRILALLDFPSHIYNQLSCEPLVPK